jgi:hypothetical protein
MTTMILTSRRSTCETLGVLAPSRQSRRSRQLASERRAALVARKQVRERLVAASRQIWPILLGLVVVPPAAAIPFVALKGGELRWVVLGMCLAIGPWLASVVLIVMSGVAPRAAGTLAEEWTTQELRRLKKRGWRVVTGLTLPDIQVDHVAVGPPGVLVLETKWSGDPWFGRDADSFMHGRLDDAVGQANKRRFWVANKLRNLIDKSDVHGVLVLWSPPGSPTAEHKPEDVDGTTVLLGTELGSWLYQFDETHSARVSADVVWAKVEELARAGDELDTQRGLVQRPGLMSTYVRNVLGPVTAIALAGYGFFGSVHLGWAPAPSSRQSRP